MKKLFVMAAAALFFAACGGNGGSSSNVEPIKDGVTLETEKYSVMVPQGMEESFRYDNTVNATAEDGSLFAINFMEGGPTKSQLKTTGENYKAMVHALDQEATIGEPVVDGNVVYLKSTVDGKGRIDYTMLKEDRVGVMGSITCPQDQTDNWEKQLFPILKTVVFK